MIEVTDLTKVFGKTVAVDHLTFTVRPGVVTGFLGPNGAGKSTTMRMILGLDNPTSGSALINGDPYTTLPDPLTKVGSLLDANWIHPNRSARAHLRWMARSNGLPAGRVAEVLDLVGLSEVAGKKAGQFSLGMKQRLGLAGALLGDPQVLLFDEPVNGLDPEGILWIRTFMRRLASQGRTVLVSSHLLSEMAQTADHLVVIGKGKLIADASTNDFIAAAARSTVRVRSPRLAELAELLRREPDASVERASDGQPGAGQRGAAGDGQAGGLGDGQAGGLGDGQAGAVGAGQPGAVGDGQAGAALTVTGVAIERIGELAAASGIALHELSPQNGSLEQAFMELTGQSAEFSSHWDSGAPPPGGVTDPYAAAATAAGTPVPAVSTTSEGK